MGVSFIVGVVSWKWRVVVRRARVVAYVVCVDINYISQTKIIDARPLRTDQVRHHHVA